MIASLPTSTAKIFRSDWWFGDRQPGFPISAEQTPSETSRSSAQAPALCSRDLQRLSSMAARGGGDAPRTEGSWPGTGGPFFFKHQRFRSCIPGARCLSLWGHNPFPTLPSPLLLKATGSIQFSYFSAKLSNPLSPRVASPHPPKPWTSRCLQPDLR